jgi:hypothetical protein
MDGSQAPPPGPLTGLAPGVRAQAGPVPFPGNSPMIPGRKVFTCNQGAPQAHCNVVKIYRKSYPGYRQGQSAEGPGAFQTLQNPRLNAWFREKPRLA